jgi:hypothetical protein
MPNLQSHPAETVARADELERYFAANVAASGALTCATCAQCRSSHPGIFYPAQQHHVGRHYDLVRDGKPLRIVVVGQEYGHGPAFVTLTHRSDMIVGTSGTESRFKADGKLKARNPHMRGCTSLLRLILGRGLGTDYDGEFLDIAGERAHLFECFALVNFLLCSAVPASDRPETDSLNGKPGRSTRTMQANCATHFRAALDILEPTIVVAQGYGVRKWIARAYGLPARRPQDGVERLQQATLLSFSHPSAHGALNWGLNERMPYLVNVVAPTIELVCDATEALGVLRTQSGRSRSSLPPRAKAVRFHTMRFLVITCALVLTSTMQAQDKPRVYVTDSNSWQISGGFAATSTAAAGAIRGGASPQTAEIIKTFGERCPNVTVTSSKEKADFAILLDHEGGKGLARRDNKVVVFAKDGDVVYSGSTRSLGNSVKDACAAIQKTVAGQLKDVK